MLTLKEDFLLLCLDDVKGSLEATAYLGAHVGLAAACIHELAISGRVDVTGPTVAVLDDRPTGDRALDTALHHVATSKKPRDMAHWLMMLQATARTMHALDPLPASVRDVPKLLAKENLWAVVLHGLVAKGILRVEQAKVLWIFPVTRHPQQDGRPEQSLKGRLHRVVLGGAPIEDEETATLLGLIKACQLERPVFGCDEAKRARARLEELTRGDALAKATRQSIQNVQAAVMAATSAAMVACIASSTS